MSPPLMMNNDSPPGFSFDNLYRNRVIENLATSSGAPLPSAKKTGTTIVGITFAGGVVLGADTRATGGTEVVEKNCIKLHNLAPNIYCAGAGTAADTEKVTDMVRGNLELLRFNMDGEQTRVITACTHLKRHLHRYQGYIQAALVLGGCDINGPHVYQIYPQGSTGKLPYTTMGSGSLAAMSVFETGWRSDLNETEAVALVQRAIGAGIFNDLGSGSNCDICVISLDGMAAYHRNVWKPNELAPLRALVKHSARFVVAPGTTPILETKFTPHPPGMKERYATLDNAAAAAEEELTEMEVES